MKTFLLSLTILSACLAATQSAYVPYLTWENDLGDLKSNDFLEKEEQAPRGLDCFSCDASDDQSCTATQNITQCFPGLICYTLQLVSSNSVTNFSKGCFPPEFCDDVCNTFNTSVSGALQSCVATCCNTSGCNEGPLPTTETPLMTTEETTTNTENPTTTSAPTTTMVPTTTMAPTTTAAPTPTTALVCGGALSGRFGVFTSPNFPNNYPNNANCTWTIIPPNGILLISFLYFRLESCKDFVEIFVGNHRIRRLTGLGYRRFSRCSYGDEPNQPYNDGEVDYYNDDNSDNYYDDNDADKYYDNDDVNVDGAEAGNDDEYDVINDDDIAAENDDYDDANEDDAYDAGNGDYDDVNEDDIDDDVNDVDVDGADDENEPENGEYLAEANGWGRGRRRWRWGRRRRPRPLPRCRSRRCVGIRGDGQTEVKIVFTSNDSGTRRGFKARFFTYIGRRWRWRG